VTQARAATSPKVPCRCRWCRTLVIALVALAACGDQGEQKLKSARSWSATALAVARAWEQGEVPTAYAKRALRKAADELAKGALPEAAEPVDELREALERGDRAAVRRLIEEIGR
jgi:hypothetical protein